MKMFERLSDLKVCDLTHLIAQDAVVLSPGLSLEKAAEKVSMSDRVMRQFFVVDEQNRLIGALSAFDLMQCVVPFVARAEMAAELMVQASSFMNLNTVGSVMDPSPYTVTLDTPLNELFVEKEHGGKMDIPVLDTNRRLLGVISPESVIFHFCRTLHRAA